MSFFREKVIIYLLQVLLVLSSDRVLLSDVKTLVLRKGHMTTGQRSSPVQQLSCSGDCSEAPSSVLCAQVGFDGVDATWECKAELPVYVKFGHIDVSCEGYDYPDDRYILAGSCGLRYTLEVDYNQKRKYERGNDHQSQRSHYYHSNIYAERQSSESGWGNVFMLVVIGVIIYFIVKSCINPNDGSSYRGGGGFGNYPGGPYPGDSYPSDTSRPSSSFPHDKTTSSSSSSSSTYSRQQPPPSGQSGPGFWTGFFGGGGLGYLLGRRSAGYNNGYGYGGYGGYGGLSTRRNYNSGYSSFSGTSSSAPTVTRTSYGTTSRR